MPKEPNLSNPLIVGFDGGGTSVRVAIADLSGRILSEYKGSGINPNSGGEPQTVLKQALEGALDQIDVQQRHAIVGGVAGLAGAVTNYELLSGALKTAWDSCGLGGQVKVVSDVVVAFWSGFPISDSEAASEVSGGSVLIAGTGAVAGHVVEHELVAMSDGYGYLLGDRGGGVWLGVKAVQAALDGASGRGPATILTDLILPDRNSTALIASSYMNKPRDMGRYGPYIDRAYEAGDDVATEIVALAVKELFQTITALPSSNPSEPIVLVGSIAAGANPVGQGLRALLDEHRRQYLIGGSGLAGALALAARRNG